MVSLDDAREFLRMDGQEDDGVIASLLAAAESRAGRVRQPRRRRL